MLCPDEKYINLIDKTMIGEAWAAIAHIRPRLQMLRDEREIFRLANDETMHPFIFDKKMREFDRLIAAYEEEIADWEEVFDDLCNSEMEELEEYYGEDPDPFQETFDQLCEIDGINPEERFDRIITIAHLKREKAESRRA